VLRWIKHRWLRVEVGGRLIQRKAVRGGGA